MKNAKHAGLLLLTLIGTAASAQTSAPVELKRCGKVFTADGKRIGFVSAVSRDREGAATTVELIFGSKILRIPAATVTSAGKNVCNTSLNYADVVK